MEKNNLDKETSKDLKKKPVGRKPISKNEKRERFLLYLNRKEHLFMLDKIRQSKYSNLSQYVRGNLIDYNKNIQHINPLQFLDEVSKLGLEVKKVGTNINQLAKHANEMAKTGVVQPLVAEALFEKLETYYQLQTEINEKLKEVLFV